MMKRNSKEWKRAQGIALVTHKLFVRRCRAIGVDCEPVDAALAALAEREAMDSLLRFDEAAE